MPLPTPLLTPPQACPQSRRAVRALVLGLFFCLCPPMLAWAAPPSAPNAISGQLSGTAEQPAADAPRTISAGQLFASVLMNAENGQPGDMLAVGSLYEQGVGVPRNFTKALEWYQRAADAGEKEAYLRLGRCYEIGMGAAADMSKAVANFQKSAAMGFAPAQHTLAGLYLQGRGLPRDENKGVALLTQAADAGEAAALFDLGVILRDGLFGRKAEPDKARAAMLREGAGGKADPEEALAWLLALQSAGAQGPGLEEAGAELKGKLSPPQAAAAEKTAAERLADWNKRRGIQ